MLKRINKSCQNNNGMVMVMALFIFLALSVLITVLIRLTYQEVNFTDHYYSSCESQQAVDSGIDVAAYLLDEFHLDNGEFKRHDTLPSVSTIDTSIGGELGSDISLNIERIGMFDKYGNEILGFTSPKVTVKYKVIALGKAQHDWSGHEVKRDVEVIMSALYTRKHVGLLTSRWMYTSPISIETYTYQ